MEMSRWLQGGGKADLVCISESMQEPAAEALVLVRDLSDAPIVLFQVTGHYYHEKLWDLEVRASARRHEWLAAIAALLEQRPAERRGEK